MLCFLKGRCGTGIFAFFQSQPVNIFDITGNNGMNKRSLLNEFAELPLTKAVEKVQTRNDAWINTCHY